MALHDLQQCLHDARPSSCCVCACARVHGTGYELFIFSSMLAPHTEGII